MSFKKLLCTIGILFLIVITGCIPYFPPDQSAKPVLGSILSFSDDVVDLDLDILGPTQPVEQLLYRCHGDPDCREVKVNTSIN